MNNRPATRQQPTKRVSVAVPSVCLAAIPVATLDDADRRAQPVAVRHGVRRCRPPVLRPPRARQLRRGRPRPTAPMHGPRRRQLPLSRDRPADTPVGQPIAADLDTFSAVLCSARTTTLVRLTSDSRRCQRVGGAVAVTLAPHANIYVDPRYGRWSPRDPLGRAAELVTDRPTGRASPSSGSDQAARSTSRSRRSTRSATSPHRFLRTTRHPSAVARPWRDVVRRRLRAGRHVRRRLRRDHRAARRRRRRARRGAVRRARLAARARAHGSPPARRRSDRVHRAAGDVVPRRRLRPARHRPDRVSASG